MRVALCCLLAACGRLHFGDQTVTDAQSVPALCMPNATAPDPLTITGTTFRYTSFDNSTRMQLASVTVQALDASSGTSLATANSDAMGRYALSVQTAGVAPHLVLAYSLIGSFETRVAVDRPIDRHVTGANDTVWSVGDGPVWNQAGMDSFYAAAGTSRLATRGTLNIAIRDCAGEPVGGVVVDVTPAPEKIMYQADDGALLDSAPTQPRFATAFGVNAIPVPTTITASGGGFTFPPVTVMVAPDQFNTLAIVHADP